MTSFPRWLRQSHLSQIYAELIVFPFPYNLSLRTGLAYILWNNIWSKIGISWLVALHFNSRTPTRGDADCLGLYLVVRGGSRVWVARVPVIGKRPEFRLGLPKAGWPALKTICPANRCKAHR